MQPQTIASWAEAEGRYEIVFYPATATTLDEPLSPRELEVATLVAAGLSSKIIAHKLGISNWTVCTHLRRTFSKLGVTTRAAMVARLHQAGSLR